MPETTVVTTTHPGWTHIRMDREARRNALDRGTRQQLLAALEAARGARAVVLTGTGGSFCAGLDLKQRAAELAQGIPDTAGEEAIALNMALREHPAVVIAAVNGGAYGGGVTLINSCDLAVAADSATLACPEVSFATYASMAGPTGQLLLTRKRAAWLLLANEKLDAATAERWGLLNEVVPAGTLEARAAALAARIAGFDAATLDETKKALNHLPAATTPAAWRAALEYGQTVNTAIRQRRAVEAPEQAPAT